MARKRMIDPTIWADSRFGKMSPDAQIMFIGMFCNADDEGRLPGDALYLSSIIFPYRGLTQKQAIAIRDEVLSKMRSVTLYEVEDQEYLQFRKWALYQSINRPSPSKYPPLSEQSVKDHETLTPNRIEENRREKKRREEKRVREENSLDYLQNLPSIHVAEISGKHGIPETFVRSKAEELWRYCKAHGKSYTDYRQFLINAVVKDSEKLKNNQPKVMHL